VAPALQRAWDALAPLEALVLNRLSVFAERWTLDAAVYVCSADGLSVEHVAALHDALVAPT